MMKASEALFELLEARDRLAWEERKPSPSSREVSFWTEEVERLKSQFDSILTSQPITATPDLVAALRETRKVFTAEYDDTGAVLSVGYDSKALRPLVALLDAALAGSSS